MAQNRVLLLRKSICALQWEVARDVPVNKYAALDPMTVTCNFPFQRGPRRFLRRKGSETKKSGWPVKINAE
jgi:hypothetical protein